MSTRIALLHLSPQPGAVEENMRVIGAACLAAVRAGAKTIVTPELAISGYGFSDLIGVDWIAAGQASRAGWASALARRCGASLLLGTPERDPISGLLHNSILVFDGLGEPIGRHRKINCLRIGAEAWSSPGNSASVVVLPDVGIAGLFVCADMASNRLITATYARGPDLFISSANWGPGDHGPTGQWEEASKLAPVLVCNRIGEDVIDFSGAETIAAVNGQRVHTHTSADPAIVLVDWHAAHRRIEAFDAIPLSAA